MAQLAQDIFTRGSYPTNLGGGDGWTKCTGDNFLQVVSNGVLESSVVSATSNSSAIWTGLVWPNDQYSEVTFGTVPVGSAVLALFVRADGAVRASTNRYEVDINSTSPTNVNLYSIVAGTATNIGTATVVFANGDVVRLTANGTTISVTVNGVVKITATSSTIASGSPGIALYSPVNLTSCTINYWRGGDLSPVSPALVTGQTGSAGAGLSNTLSVSFPNNVAPGNFVVASTVINGSQNSQPVPTMPGETFIKAGTSITDGSGYVVCLYYIQNATGGNKTITWTVSGNYELHIMAGEFSGMARTGVLDGTTQNKAVGQLNPMVSANITPSNAGELIVAAFRISNVAVTYVNSNGFIDIANQSNNTLSYMVGVGGVTHAQWTISTQNLPSTTIIGAFNQAIGIPGSLMMLGCGSN